MAAVSRENWVERIRDPKIECMSRDEMAALQSRRLVEVVNRVYNNVEFYRKKMQDMGIEPGDIKSIEDIGKLPFTTKEDLRENYPFGLLAIPKKDVVRVQGTSGTTGKLTIAPYSQKDVEVWGECVAREWQDLPRKILYMSVMVMVCLPEALDWILEQERSGQWRFRCLQAIQSVR